MITEGGCTDSATPTCGGGNDSVSKTWRGTGGSNTDIVGVENVATDSIASSSSFRGDVNTSAIVIDASNGTNSAADFCNDMSYKGFSDWVLPSKSELAYIYCKAITGGSHNTSNPEEDINCVSVGGKSSEIPGFSSVTYVSSTEQDATNIRSQNFSSGNQATKAKSDFLRVRCIRRY